MANWIYNCIELPALPEWDKVAYPYAFISYYSDGYRLFLSSAPFHDSGDDDVRPKTSGELMRYDGHAGASAWTFVEQISFTGGLIATRSPMWANYDVLYRKGSVYLAASDPVAVSGNWIYNYVEIPPLPEWDKVTYPYANISYGDNHTPFYLGVTTVRTVVDNGVYTGEVSTGRMRTYTVGSDGNWVRGSEMAYRVIRLIDYPLIWTNDDIINVADGSVYLAASESVKAPQDATQYTHVWDGGTDTIPAGCETAGVLTYTCRLCGEQKTEEIPARGHTEVTDKAVAPTCTAAGLTEGAHCSVCDTVLTAQQTVPAKGHSYENGTCGACGEQDPAYVPEKDNTPTGVATIGEKHLLGLMFSPLFVRALTCKRSADNEETTDVLVSSDGYTLTDKDGVYLVPKEDE